MTGLYTSDGKVLAGTSAKDLLAEVYGEEGLGDGTVSIGTEHVVRRLFLTDILQGRVLDAGGNEPTVLKLGEPAFVKAVEKLGDAVRDPSRIIYWRNPVVVAWTMFPGGNSPLILAKGDPSGLRYREEKHA